MGSRPELEVLVVRAEGLRGADRGGLSDPYVQLSVPGVKIKHVRTKTRKKDLNPEWNETKKLSHPRLDWDSKLLVEVFDEDLFSHDKLGRCEVSVSSLRADGLPSQIWADLTGKNATGKIELQLKALNFPPKRGAAPAEKAPADKQAADAAAVEPATYTVRVERASGLVAADKGGTSDPFVKLLCGKERHKTKALKKTLEPEWNENFVLGTNPKKWRKAVLGPYTPLEVQVWDKDEGMLDSDDLLGSAKFPLSELITCGSNGREWPLVKGGNAAGTVRLSLLDMPPGAAAASGQQAAATERRPMTAALTVLGARGLRASDKNGSSDPYVVVRFGTHKKRKTAVAKATLEPRWDQVLVFGSDKRPVTGEEDVTLEVRDKDGLIDADDKLGRLTLPLSELLADSKLHADGKWYALGGKGARNDDDGDDGVSPEIQLLLEVDGGEQLAAAANAADGQGDGSGANTVVRELLVTVVKAEGLPRPPRRRGESRRNARVSSVVELRLQGSEATDGGGATMESRSDSHLATTKPVALSSEPEWNETLTLALPLTSNTDDDLELCVVLKHGDFVSSADLSLGSLGLLGGAAMDEPLSSAAGGVGALAPAAHFSGVSDVLQWFPLRQKDGAPVADIQLRLGVRTRAVPRTDGVADAAPSSGAPSIEVKVAHASGLRPGPGLREFFVDVRLVSKGLGDDSSAAAQSEVVFEGDLNANDGTIAVEFDFATTVVPPPSGLTAASHASAAVEVTVRQRLRPKGDTMIGRCEYPVASIPTDGGRIKPTLDLVNPLSVKRDAKCGEIHLAMRRVGQTQAPANQGATDATLTRGSSAGAASARGNTASVRDHALLKELRCLLQDASLDEEGRVDMRRAFEVFDTNNNGTISKSEIEAMLAHLGAGRLLLRREMTSLLKAFDLDPNSGELDYDSFVRFTLGRSRHDKGVGRGTSSVAKRRAPASVAAAREGGDAGDVSRRALRELSAAAVAKAAEVTAERTKVVDHRSAKEEKNRSPRAGGKGIGNQDAAEAQRDTASSLRHSQALFDTVHTSLGGATPGSGGATAEGMATATMRGGTLPLGKRRQRSASQLVAKGATPDWHHPVGGWTALHLAAGSGQADVVMWLINHGATPSEEDEFGKLPEDYAFDASQEYLGLALQRLRLGIEAGTATLDDFALPSPKEENDRRGERDAVSDRSEPNGPFVTEEDLEAVLAEWKGQVQNKWESTYDELRSDCDSEVAIAEAGRAKANRRAKSLHSKLMALREALSEAQASWESERATFVENEEKAQRRLLHLEAVVAELEAENDDYRTLMHELSERSAVRVIHDEDDLPEDEDGGTFVREATKKKKPAAAKSKGEDLPPSTQVRSGPRAGFGKGAATANRERNEMQRKSEKLAPSKHSCCVVS